MTFAELYRQCRGELSGDTADFDLSQLFASHFGGGFSLRFSDNEVSEGEAAYFRRKVKRMSDGYPLQYLLGEWEFYGITLRLGPGVLIPRPDTETLVDVALELTLPDRASLIADYCSGSGAIAIAVARHRKNARLFAVEVSDDALAFLRRNISESGCGDRIEVIKGDVREELPLPLLDMVISNPPYITRDEMEELPTQVRHEPQMALFGGEDGLDFYRVIAKNAFGRLRDGGHIVFEVGWQQKAQVMDILRENGYTGISSRRDLGGIERCVYAQKPGSE